MNNTQKQRIFDYLKKNKKATGLELLKYTGTMSYTKVISQLRNELKKKGYTIAGKFIKVKTKCNGTSRVKEYSLARLKRK